MVELGWVERLAKEAEGLGPLRIMEFCGGHTHALVHAGIHQMLPDNVQLIHGPGCPVCVLPAHHLQAVIDLLTSQGQVSLAAYGDVLRIPTLGGDSLLAAQGRGLPIHMVYSPLEVVRLAQAQPDREWVFLAIGFETTAPATAILLRHLRREGLHQVSVLCLHVCTPPAIEAVFHALPPGKRPDGIIGPGHVTLVTGLELYVDIAHRYQVPIAISGFEPVDLLESFEVLFQMRRAGEARVHNQYTRAVHPEGHRRATDLLEDTFTLRQTFTWRGLGELPNSAYQLAPQWSDWDAEKRYSLVYRDVPEHPACQCGAILRGEKVPRDCRLFGTACTPSRPYGSCMVSSEGACHAYYASAGVI